MALEPIVSLVDTNGVIVNPAGTILHRPTPFFAEIAPLTFAERGLLSWGGIEGDYADENNALVHVSPNETGLQTLSLYLEGYEDPVPTISAEVFPSNSLVSVNLFLIVDAQGNVPVGYDPSIMSNAVSLANRTFAQAAMEFVWDGSCTIVTNQSWYSTVLSLPVEGERDFVNELCEFCPDSAGVTVFLNTSFTNRVGSSVALTLSTGIPGVTHGILIPIGMLELALQHELGHACGLIDIFPMSSPFQQEPSLNDRIVSIQKMPGDWTGEWGYYRTDVTMVDVIHRMLMFNLNLPGVEFGMDIPSGPVRGYNVKGDSGMLSVGLEALSRTPVSRRLIP